MEWQEIKNQAIEVLELHHDILAKYDNTVIAEIKNRNNNYCLNPDLDIRNLKNGALEHQVMITPYQIIIIKKVEDIIQQSQSEIKALTTKNNPEEAYKCVNELKQTFELTSKCLDLVINIEKLSKMEYEPQEGYENSEYANLIQKENSIFDKARQMVPITPYEEYEQFLKKNLEEHLRGLSIEAKQNLFIETFTLSYSKNSYEWFAKEKLLLDMSNKNNYSVQQHHILEKLYIQYQKGLAGTKKLMLLNMPIQSLYDELKVIYDTDIFKQKIMKK